jgi:hypothetical protein
VNQKDEKGKLACIKIIGFAGNSQCIVHHPRHKPPRTIHRSTIHCCTIHRKNHRAQFTAVTIHRGTYYRGIIHRRHNSHGWQSVNQKDEKRKLTYIKIIGFAENSPRIIHRGTIDRDTNHRQHNSPPSQVIAGTIYHGIIHGRHNSPRKIHRA